MPLTTHDPDQMPPGWTGWTTNAINNGPIIRGEAVLETVASSPATSSTATAAWGTPISDVSTGFSVAFNYRVNVFTSLTLDILGSGGAGDTASLRLTDSDVGLYDSSTLLASVRWNPRLQGRIVWHFSEIYTFVDVNNVTLVVTTALPYATFSTNLIGLRFTDMAQTTYFDRVSLYRDSREAPSSATYGFTYSSP